MTTTSASATDATPWFADLLEACADPARLIRALSDADRRAFAEINAKHEDYSFRIKLLTPDGTRFVTLHVSGDLVVTELEPSGAAANRLPHPAPAR